MTVEQFENGYWYATDLKAFAQEIGISAVGSLRKDEIEKLIIQFLKEGKIKKSSKPAKKSGAKDFENGLSLKLPILNYTSNAETKSFLLKEALKIVPGLKQKSGSRYWLNRWREEQMESGRKITYGDLVKQFIKLNQTKEDFPQIPSTRFNNFISDFLKFEPGANKANAQKAWEQLKKLDTPKNYRSWKSYRSK